MSKKEQLKKLNKALSWKILFPLGLVLWIPFYFATESIMMDAIGFIGLFIFIMGVIDANRVLRTHDKKVISKGSKVSKGLKITLIALVVLILSLLLAGITLNLIS